MEIVVTVVFLFVVLFFAYVIHAGFEREISRIYSNEMERLSTVINKVSDPSNGYRFYTNGYPYVWVNASYNEIIGSINNACEDLKVLPYRPCIAYVYVMIKNLSIILWVLKRSIFQHYSITMNG